MSKIGSEFEVEISKSKAAKLIMDQGLESHCLPKMGWQVSVADDKDRDPFTKRTRSSLMLANVSGQFSIRSYSWSKENWLSAYGVDFTQYAK